MMAIAVVEVMDVQNSRCHSQYRLHYQYYGRLGFRQQIAQYLLTSRLLNLVAQVYSLEWNDDVMKRNDQNGNQD